MSMNHFCTSHTHNHIQKERFDYLGHLLRMGSSRLPKKIFCSQPPKGCKRKPGGQKKTIWATVDTEVRRRLSSKRLQLKLDDLEMMAQNRKQWSALFRDELQDHR